MKNFVLRCMMIAMVAVGANSVQAQTYQISDNCAQPVAVVSMAPVVGAACQSCGQAACPGCHSSGVIGCTTCDAGCSLEIKQEKEKKTCFEVEKKTICIPSVQLPFGICCKPMFARSKTIKVLKTKSYEVPVTKYIWSKADTGCSESACITCAEGVAVAPATTAPLQEAPMPQPMPQISGN